MINAQQQNRKYPEGWNTDDGRDAQLEYRLSIFVSEPQDSGVYSCITPARHTHSVAVEVKAVHCNEIIPRRGLALSTAATQMGTKVQFSCNNGNALIGSQEIGCLPSGNWSGPLPICESKSMAKVLLSASLIQYSPQASSAAKLQSRHHPAMEQRHVLQSSRVR